MTPDDLRPLVSTGEVDTVLAAFTDGYGRLLGKRIDATFFLDHTIGHGTHACDYLLTVDMEMEPVAGYEFASWELGYGDFHLVADLATLARAGWTDSSAIVLCDVVDVETHGPVPVAPRSMLARQVEPLGQLAEPVVRDQGGVGVCDPVAGQGVVAHAREQLGLVEHPVRRRPDAGEARIVGRRIGIEALGNDREVDVRVQTWNVGALAGRSGHGDQ